MGILLAGFLIIVAVVGAVILTTHIPLPAEPRTNKIMWVASLICCVFALGLAMYFLF